MLTIVSQAGGTPAGVRRDGSWVKPDSPPEGSAAREVDCRESLIDDHVLVTGRTVRIGQIAAAKGGNKVSK